ncbi:MAG: response regulator, partial [Chloroflexi bacterium]|nr:response regulator [Chloroflexota bacterium]
MNEKRVLVVDDDDSVRELLTRFLEFGEYDACSASSGEEGLRLLYDLVISDVLMPGMDGHEFCEHVREVSDVPIIMLSGQVDLEDEQEKVVKLNLGIDAFLSKPLRMMDFLDTVGLLLDRWDPAAYSRIRKRDRRRKQPTTIPNPQPRTRRDYGLSELSHFRTTTGKSSGLIAPP